MIHYRRFLFVIIFGFFISFSVFADSEKNSGNAGDQLKALLAPITTLSGTFEQVIQNEQGKILQKVSGRLALKKPAQFRWEILGKEPRLVVSDGKKVWDFDKDLEQVTVQKLDKGRTKAPIFFLTGDVSTLEQDFDISKVSDDCFELKPKKGEGTFQWIKVSFKDKILKEMEMLDQLGQRSLFTFKDIVLNGNLSEQLFHFTPPKGVDVLNNE